MATSTTALVAKVIASPASKRAQTKCLLTSHYQPLTKTNQHQSSNNGQQKVLYGQSNRIWLSCADAHTC
ncbi:MAG: hypothetical protein AAGJ69_05560 [Cyanobacteria bacterium J06559_1]